MAIFALIGGRSNLDVSKNLIEQKIISLTKKEKPNVLFCPFAATNDINKSVLKFNALIQNLSCNVRIMKSYDLDDFSNDLDWADIFYVGGGHCDDLVEIFKNNKLDIILSKYLSSRKIFCGVSAGAMLYTKSSMGDKYAYYDNSHMWNYKMVECLGYLNITICPHYNNEDLICYNDIVKKYSLNSFGIEDNTCLFIDGNKYYIIKENKTNSVYFFDKEKDYQMIPLYEGEIYEANCCFRS